MSKPRVLILGHGAMGRMFEALLKPHWSLSIWDRDLVSGEETETLESLAPGHELILFALPTAPHQELAARLADCLPPGALCVSIAKGLDAEGRSPADIFQRHFGAGGETAWGLIYGPMIARDLSEGRQGFALAAASDMATARRLPPWFAGTPLHLQSDDDPIGAAWAAILKNVYVPLVGMADGLGLGDNMRGFLLCEAVSELARIVVARGGRAETAYGLAGLGDLITTATSPASHHRRIGEALAVGDRSGVLAEGGNVRSEGVNTAARVMEHDLFPLDDFPLFALTTELLKEPHDIRGRLGDYLARRFATGAAS